MFTARTARILQIISIAGVLGAAIALSIFAYVSTH